MKKLLSIIAVSVLTLCANSCFSYTEAVYEIVLAVDQQSGMGSSKGEAYTLCTQIKDEITSFSKSHGTEWIAENCKKSDKAAIAKFEAAQADLKVLESQISKQISSVSDDSYKFTLSYTLICTSFYEEERVLGEYSVTFSNQ